MNAVVERRRPHWVRWVLLVVCVAMLVMWVYAFGFATKDGRYRVDDDTWRTTAEARCATAKRDIDGLATDEGGRITNPTAEQMKQRATLVDTATDVLGAALGDIDALPLDGERDRQLVDSWMDFYATVIADRRAYTERLRAGSNEPYEETQVGGGPVSNVITDFTTANEIRSCAPPLDLASGGF
jgi:hypothetical protein